jgi:hypothetical protein
MQKRNLKSHNLTTQSYLKEISNRNQRELGFATSRGDYVPDKTFMLVASTNIDRQPELTSNEGLEIQTRLRIKMGLHEVEKQNRTLL